MKLRLVSRSEMSQVREILHRLQKGYCRLCRKPVSIEDGVLDHSKSTGRIRGLLHRSCNTFEGKIRAACRWMGKTRSVEENLKLLIEYLELDPTSLIHPNYMQEIRRAKPRARVGNTVHNKRS